MTRKSLGINEPIQSLGLLQCDRAMNDAEIDSINTGYLYLYPLQCDRAMNDAEMIR